MKGVVKIETIMVLNIIGISYFTAAKSQAEDSEDSDSEADIDYKPERDEDWKKVHNTDQKY